jgi:hypothetical protein
MTIQDMLKEKGVQVKNLGQKERQHAGSAAASGVAKPVPASKKFVFAAPKVPQIGDLLQSPEERQKALADFAEFSRQVREQMPEFVRNIRLIEAMSSEERPIWEDTFRQLNQGVTEMLNYGNSAARQVSVLAYAASLVATCPEYHYSVEHTIAALFSVGFLTIESGSGRGTVRVYSKFYTLTRDFRSPEAQAVLPAINDLVRRTVEAGRRRFEEKFTNLVAGAGETPLSITEFKTGKSGRILLEVPDQTLADGKFLRGGWLLLESANGQVKVLDSAGFIQRMADDLREAGTFVHASQIGKPSASFLHPEVFKLLRWVSVACQAAEDRATREAEQAKWAEQTDAERAELGKGATLTVEEFFLGGKTGTVLYDFGAGRVFDWRTKSATGAETKVSVSDLIALVERNERGQIRVAACPDRLKEFFAEHGELEVPGDKFYNLGKLGALLRIGFASAVHVARQAGRETTEKAAVNVTAEVAAKVGVDPSTLTQAATN